jgi:hypothetical protein
MGLPLSPIATAVATGGRRRTGPPRLSGYHGPYDIIVTNIFQLLELLS